MQELTETLGAPAVSQTLLHVSLVTLQPMIYEAMHELVSVWVYRWSVFIGCLLPHCGKEDVAHNRGGGSKPGKDARTGQTIEVTQIIGTQAVGSKDDL